MSVPGNRAVIVGAGFTGLTAALTLARAGRKVLVLESDPAPGGLAGTFELRDGVRVEKFYHHWFNNDLEVPRLVAELGLQDRIVTRPSRTGVYYGGRRWRLSTPLDLLRFAPLSPLDRLRLGLLVVRARRVKDWRSIEHLAIREWLEPLCGPRVFGVVWEPLIRAKFSVYADAVNAVWFWNKLVLRGGTRDNRGGEELAYFRGGFGSLAEAMRDAIRDAGGDVRCATPATSVRCKGDVVEALGTPQGDVDGEQFLFTPALPIIADLFADVADAAWIERLRRIRYLGNVCLVLELDRSLSDTYWMNVNDPGFPFVAVIEHTNLDPPENYGGRHVVYLSRYLPTEDPLWSCDDHAYLEFALEHLRRMFPALRLSWVTGHRVWRARYAQPVAERNHSRHIPPRATPFRNALISTMAQIYPEDRGTNYAIREGRAVAGQMLEATR